MAPWNQGRTLGACLVMTTLVHLGCLFNLTMTTATIAIEEDHLNSENETHHTKG